MFMKNGPGPQPCDDTCYGEPFFPLSQLTKTVIAAGLQIPRVFGGSLPVERNLLELRERQNLHTRYMVELTR